MNIFKLAFELFVIYILYKIVFDFVLPIYRTTRQMKQKMGEMHQKMQEQQEQGSRPFTKVPSSEPVKKGAADDYIEYEEIK